MVERDPETLHQITSVLEALGYEVASTSDPDQALQDARALKPDLGIFDVRLRGETGRSHPGQVMLEEMDIPVVLLDAMAAANSVEGERAANSYGYLTRPFDDSSLGPVVELALHRHRTERVLSLSERRFRQLFEQNPAGVVVEAVDGRIVECNQALATLLGYRQEQLRGEPASLLFQDPTESLARRRRVAEGATIQNEEVRLRHALGHAVWVLDNAVLIPDPLTGRGQILRTVLDITERKQIEQGLEQLAYRDPLTGLANRRLLEMRGEQTLAEAYRRGGRAAVVFLDLIGFKQVNDKLGHRAGDELIVRVARRLEGCLRRTDTAARFGGDEFVVILSGVEDVEAAERAAYRLLDQLAAGLELDEAPVRARAGLAIYPDLALDLPGLMRAADRALTRAKGLGGAVVVTAESARSRLSPA